MLVMWSTIVGCCVIILLTIILLVFKRKQRHHDDVVTATGEFEPCTGPWTSRDPTKIAKVTMTTSSHRLGACGETEQCPTVPNVKVTPTLLPEHFYEDDVTMEDGYFRSVTSSLSKSSSFGDVIANGSLLGDVTIPKSSDDEVMNYDDVTNAESLNGDVTEGLLTDEKRTLSHYDI